METRNNSVGRPAKILTAVEQLNRNDARAHQKLNYERRYRLQRNQARREKYKLQHQETNLRKRVCRTAFLGIVGNVENVKYHDIGDMSCKCQFCGGLSFSDEKGRSRNSCCHSGKVKLKIDNDYPQFLKDLLVGEDERSKHFRENIRVYNNAFAFASFSSTNVDICTRGPYCMKTRGSVKRKGTTSLSSEGTPRYGQVYIYDDDETVKFRLQQNLRHDLLIDLHEILKGNPYAQCYRKLYEVHKETNQSTVKLKFLKFESDDQRRYNSPTCPMIAAIITTTDGSIPEKVDLIVYPSAAKECDFISTTSHHADPMLFPILFPHGEHGWSYNLKNSNMKTITPTQFYSYKLAFRGCFNHLLSCGRLTQQYVINCYLTAEGHRLSFLRFNQSKLRSECYQGLLDHVRNCAANESHNLRIGNLLILPSTFQGSARSMQQLYQDAMAIARKIGRPDLFITMTCNPKWPEIKRYLKTLPSSLTAIDIPLFTTRLFYQKTLMFVNDLQSAFGDILAYVYTVEFQKRGLPHMHLLVTLKSKLLTPDDVDKFICAEIPKKSEQPALWHKVTKHMLHGPHRQGLPCYDEHSKSCKKKFPKDFIDHTDMTDGGFPKYRRRNNVAEMNTYHGKPCDKIHFVDNSMVVPYNPFLLMKYDCHINVEYCASIMGIKYIHKYIHKGHDRARIALSKTSDTPGIVTDEIQEFLDSRYLSATESAWRLCELPLHGRSHSVERLPVHLEGMNRVLFEEGKEAEAVEAHCNTKLTAYFSLNAEDREARNTKYEDIPLYYRWNVKEKKWVKRLNRAHVVSRLISVSSKAVEQFHLKLILRNITGATSFLDLKTVNNVLYNTFKEAAEALGLVSSDSDITDVMSEACMTLMPHELRHFFVYILLGCENINASEIWLKFKKDLSEDVGEQKALNAIAALLENENSCLQKFGLENPDVPVPAVIEMPDYKEHFSQYCSMYEMLNSDQRNAFDRIALSIDNSSPKLFYIDGPGGSGKTFLYKCIIHYAIAKQKNIFTIAWTGIAAILLPLGRTAHKSFQLPLNLIESSTLYWNSKTKKIMKDTDIFIWDEASMIPAAALESIDYALRDICKTEEPFGGKTLLLGGDYRQVLPVIKRGGRLQVISSTIKRSYIWNEFTYFTLSKNMRVNATDDYFSKWLLKIGNGEIEKLLVPQELYCEDLVEQMYKSKDERLFVNQAILTPRNDDASTVNNKILNVLPGKVYELRGVDKATPHGVDNTDESTELSFPLDYINSLMPSGFPPYILKLKIGAIVMLLRNLCVSDGLCNGTRLTVEAIHQKILRCRILTGDQNGNVVYIPRVKLDTSSDTEMPFVLHRTQFPLRLSFAMTINKSQGQSFDRVGLYIVDQHPIFSHGQLYVALSRCRSYNGIKIQLSKENKKREIENIVYKEII